jgi:hypothetical protein
VIGNGWYPAVWQTWRLPAFPSPETQPFDVQIQSNLPADIEYRISAHLLMFSKIMQWRFDVFPTKPGFRWSPLLHC